MKKEYSIKLRNSIFHSLNELDIKYNFDKPNGIIYFDLSVGKLFGAIKFVILIRFTDYIVYGFFPMNVDCHNFAAISRISEAIGRANSGLCLGNFELDYDVGIIKYKCFTDCSGIEPSTALLSNSLVTTCTMMNTVGHTFINAILYDKDDESPILPRPEDLTKIIDTCDAWDSIMPLSMKETFEEHRKEGSDQKQSTDE